VAARVAGDDVISATGDEALPWEVGCGTDEALSPAAEVPAGNEVEVVAPRSSALLIGGYFSPCAKKKNRLV
jgi:hypothetical protein